LPATIAYENSIEQYFVAVDPTLEDDSGRAERFSLDCNWSDSFDLSFFWISLLRTSAIPFPLQFSFTSRMIHSGISRGCLVRKKKPDIEDIRKI